MGRARCVEWETLFGINGLSRGKDQDPHREFRRGFVGRMIHLRETHNCRDQARLPAYVIVTFWI